MTAETGITAVINDDHPRTELLESGTTSYGSLFVTRTDEGGGDEHTFAIEPLRMIRLQYNNETPVDLTPAQARALGQALITAAADVDGQR